MTSKVIRRVSFLPHTTISADDRIRTCDELHWQCSAIGHYATSAFKTFFITTVRTPGFEPGPQLWKSFMLAIEHHARIEPTFARAKFNVLLIVPRPTDRLDSVL
jgi:hypothetical protein